MATNHEVGSSILSGRTISLFNSAYRRSLALLGISPAGSRFAHARKPAQIRFSPGAPVSLVNPACRRSLALLGISPAGSRFAHARKAAQVRFSPGAPFPYLFIVENRLRSRNLKET